jgi:hypothetical protein
LRAENPDNFESPHENGSFGKRTVYFFALALILCLAFTTLGIRDRITNPYAHSNDLTTSIYWMNRNIDPALYPNDLLADYSSDRTTPVIEAIYRFGSIFTTPYQISRFFPFFITLCFVPLAFFLGLKFGGDEAGFLMAVSLFLVTWYQGPGPGTSGELAILINIGVACALAYKSPIALAVLMIFAAVAYPPAALVAGMACVVWIVFGVAKKSFDKKSIGTLVVGGGVALSYMVVKYLGGSSAFGEMVTRDQMRTMPEFGAGGVFPFFFESLWPMLQSDNVGIELHAPMIFLIFISVVLFVFQKKKLLEQIPMLIGVWLACGVVGFVLAHVFMLHLLAPAKYLVQPLLITLCCVCIGGIMSIRNQKGAKIFLNAFLILVGIVCWPTLKKYETPPRVTQGLEAVAELPIDAIIAGHPETMNLIPIFAKRSAYANRELSEAYYPQYYDRISGRIDAMLKAYYAKTDAEVLAFCQKTGVTHFLVVKEEFSGAMLLPERMFYKPQGPRIAQWIGDRREFALENPPKQWIVAQDDKSYLVKPTKLIVVE